MNEWKKLRIMSEEELKASDKEILQVARIIVAVILFGVLLYRHFDNPYFFFDWDFILFYALGFYVSRILPR